MKNLTVVTAVVSSLCMLTVSNATVWYVHPDSTLNSIQTALNLCSPNDTVMVGPGTYSEHIIIPVMQGIHLVSEYGSDTTIIDGSNTGIVISVSSGVDTTVVIRGFTLQHGHSTIWDGAGINCVQASPIIENNNIINNAADSTGSGVMCYIFSSPVIRNNTFEGNSTKWGGAICCMYNCNPIIMDNTFQYNTAQWNGGAIALYYGSDAIICGNTITDNTAGYAGGGIECWGSAAMILHNTINNNTGTRGAGVRCRQLCTPVIDSCDISGNIGIGIDCWDSSTVRINHCTITGNIIGIRTRDRSSPSINNNTITNNTYYGILNMDPNVTVDAEYNWWGDSTGPYHPLLNPGGLGDTVSNNVDFIPWIGQAAVAENNTPKLPAARLHMFPNPFQDIVTIHLQYPEHVSDVTLRIYDTSGRMIKEYAFSCAHYNLPQSITWSGIDQHGLSLPSGIYFLKLETEEYSETRKLILSR